MGIGFACLHISRCLKKCSSERLTSFHILVTLWSFHVPRHLVVFLGLGIPDKNGNKKQVFLSVWPSLNILLSVKFFLPLVTVERSQESLRTLSLGTLVFSLATSLSLWTLPSFVTPPSLRTFFSFLFLLAFLTLPLTLASQTCGVCAVVGGIPGDLVAVRPSLWQAGYWSTCNSA